jgi:hypothetical protein
MSHARGFALVLLFSSWSPAVAQENAEDLARSAVDRFMKAFKAKDLPSLMDTVDVPWFHQSEKIIRDRAELEKAYRQLFEKSKDVSKLNYAIKVVSRYQEVRGKTSEEEQKLLDGVILADDRVVLIEIDQPARKKETVVLLVRIREGKARIVGLKN